MLLKTHFAIGIFAIILFFPFVNNPLTFVIMALIGTIFPDLDTRFSRYGKNPAARAMQMFTNHRGIIHSITFCALLSLILAFFIPVLAFGFFLGYSVHLLADSFTKLGISMFWPLQLKSEGLITTGSKVEKGIFVGFIIADVLLTLVWAVRFF